MPTGESWDLVESAVPCRYDPSYHYRSLGDVRPEEIVGRDNALLFVQPSADIKVRDIITITNDATGIMKDRQYDVVFVSPATGSLDIEYLECTVTFRDNPVVLP